MKFYKMKLIGCAPPETEQAKVITDRIGGHTCVTRLGEHKAWGMLLPGNHILSLNPVVYDKDYEEEGDCSFSHNGKVWFPTKCVHTLEQLQIRRAMGGNTPKSIPPISYSRSGQFLFASIGGQNILTFERMKGKMGMGISNRDPKHLWAGLPVFTRFGMLSGIVVGVRKKQILVVAPHSIFTGFRSDASEISLKPQKLKE